MSRPPTVRFADALQNAKRILHTYADSLSDKLLLIRDVRGRIAVVSSREPDDAIRPIAEQLSQQLGAYGGAPHEVWLGPKDFFDAQRLFDSPDVRRLFAPGVEDGPSNVWFVERSIAGLDWMRPPLGDEAAKGPPKLVFYGLKGGVGRSTALVLVARALARAGARVLVLDLDLESPGLGPVLLPAARVPRYGAVDYLIEQGVGQADDELVADMVVPSPLVSQGVGQIRVVPASGSSGDYLAKLGRVYQPVAVGEGVCDVAERLEDMVARLVEQDRTDVVLIDSRAGLHDLAAAVVTRLRANALLFGLASEQTWHGYHLLFDDWRCHPQLPDIRAQLKMVAGLVPETERAAYMKRFIEGSHDLFSNTLYEEAEAMDLDAFNFDLRDSSAPHHPLVVYWSRALQELDPMTRPNAVSDDQLLAAGGALCRGVGDLLALEVRP